MNLIFLIGFGYFCFNQVILTSTAKIQNGNIPEEISKSIEFPSYGRREHKTQLMDLNTDCLFLVLNHLDLNSLLSITEAHIGLNLLVLKIVKKIFLKNMINIVILPSDDLRFSLRIETHGDYIQMTSVSIVERVLKNFGYLIENLTICRLYPEMDNATKTIYKLVNVHCSKTLSEIWLDNSLDNFLDEFTNQFENVQMVDIRNSLSTDRRLNEIFPSVRRLDFHLYDVSNTDSINVNYANLEHLNLYINKDFGSLTEKLAAELIRKNPHIQSLTLERASAQLIKIAADSLPQLERLKLDIIQREHFNELISFPNLRIFETSQSDLDCLFLNLKFGNVEEVHTDGLADSMFGETGFFATNTNLKKLQLISPHLYFMTNENLQLENLANANSTLQDIFIKEAYGFDSLSILHLIEKSKQLERLQIDFVYRSTHECILNQLRKEINDTCSIEAFSKTIILKK